MDAGALRGTENDHEEVPCRRENRGPSRIRGRRPEWAVVVGQEQSAGQVHPLLANPWIALTLATDAHAHGAFRTGGVVGAERPLMIERAEVADIDDRSHLRKAFALEYASQQGFAARARLGGIDVEPMEQRSRLGHSRNVRRLLACVETLEP